MFFVYILESEVNGSFYVGSCRDFKNRLEYHNQGLVTSTKRYLPWSIIYLEKFSSLKEAKKRELQIKSWKKRSAIERLINKKHFLNFQ